MEILENKIKEFLKINNGYGDGFGSGSGYGSGYGSGDGSGSGYGYGFGSGSGYGYGSGYGSGYGYGDGSGDGSGSGSGSGYGDGDGYGSDYGYGDGYGYGYGDGYGSDYGYGLKTINNKTIYIIDNVPTIIIHVYKKIAKSFIVKSNFYLKPCYIAKNNNLFAHGETSKKAIKALQDKIFENMNTEDAIEEFKNKFKANKKYKGTTFYKWHHNLTGSCEMGRNNFVTEHNLNLNKMYSVKEFIELTENDYGGEIIKQLKEFYN